MSIEARSWIGTILGGHLLVPNRDERADFDRTVATIPNGTAVEIRIGPLRRPKTRDQIAYWFAVPVPVIAAHCGYPPRQMHYALLGECFGYAPGPRGVPVPNVPSIADCTVDQVRELIDWVLVWAPSELGVIIPDPDKDWKTKRHHEAAEARHDATT